MKKDLCALVAYARNEIKTLCELEVVLQAVLVLLVVCYKKHGLTGTTSMSAVAPEGLHGDNDKPEDDVASITRQASGGGDDGRDSYICVSEQVYVESGNEKKVLYSMCLGLTHRTNNDSEEQPLFSFEQEPWSMLPKNSLLRPKNSDFVHEITRRTSCTFGRLPMSTKFYILQSSLQRLNNKAGAADASRAPISSRSSTTSNDSGGGLSRTRRRRQQQELNAAGSSLTPPVESIKELAECQRQMVVDRVED